MLLNNPYLLLSILGPSLGLLGPFLGPDYQRGDLQLPLGEGVRLVAFLDHQVQLCLMINANCIVVYGAAVDGEDLAEDPALGAGEDVVEGVVLVDVEEAELGDLVHCGLRVDIKCKI